MTPSITQLQYILAVHRHKHFGRAATECFVSQPSLSTQILKVEEFLGFAIFDRSKKPILLTDKGLLFVEQAKKVVREHQKFFDLNGVDGKTSGSFHLGIIPTLAPNLLPLFVESFSKNYPDVRLTISEYKTQDIVKALQDDELDAGLLVTPLHSQSIAEQVLFYEDFYLFVSDSHQLFGRKTVNESDLKSIPIWLLEEGHCFRDQVLRVCELKKDHSVLKNVSFESGSLETLINLIRRGGGCTLLPYLATLSLSEKEKAQNLKGFSKTVPVREVSLVSSRSVLKQEIIVALENEILAALPSGIGVSKKAGHRIVEI